MYPRGGEEGDLECKRAKAIRLLHEYCHSDAQQHYVTSQDKLYKIARTSISFGQTDYHLHVYPIRK